MTHRPNQSSTGSALVMASVGLLFLTGATVVMLTTPIRFEETSPTGPRIEVTATYTPPRPTSVLPAPNAVIGDPCPGVGVVGSSVAGVVVCRELGRELRWVLSP